MHNNKKCSFSNCIDGCIFVKTCWWMNFLQWWRCPWLVNANFFSKNSPFQETIISLLTLCTTSMGSRHQLIFSLNLFSSTTSTNKSIFPLSSSWSLCYAGGFQYFSNNAATPGTPFFTFINPVVRNKLGSDGAICTSTSSCSRLSLNQLAQER